MTGLPGFLRQLAAELDAEIQAGGRSPFTLDPATVAAGLRMAAVRLDPAARAEADRELRRAPWARPGPPPAVAPLQILQILQIMPWHVVIRLPDGRVACADYRDPVARPMHKINEALGRFGPVRPELYAAVAEWLDGPGHAEQSAVCHAGLSPAGLPCGHD